MSEERLTNIEQRLDGVGADVAVLKSDVAVLKTDVAELKTDVRLIKIDIKELKIETKSLGNRIDDLGRHMRVLHEETLDRIRALGEDDSLRREMRAGFAEMRQMFADHAIPGDAADRRFAMTLDDHECRIDVLERR